MDLKKLAGGIAKSVGGAVASSISSQAEHYSKDNRLSEEDRNKFANMSNAFNSMSKGDFSYTNNNDYDDD